MKRTIKRQMSCLLIVLTTGFLACFVFLLLFTTNNIDKNTTSYLNSISFRLKERIDSRLAEKADSLHNFSVNLDENLGSGLYSLDIVEAFTKYQFEREYKSLWYVDRDGNSAIHFEGGYLKDMNKGRITDSVSGALNKCKLNSYYVVAGPPGSNHFYLIYKPYFRTFESRDDEHYFVVKYPYDIFYNTVDAVVYEEANRNHIDWLAGFAKNGLVIWSTYEELKNKVISDSDSDISEAKIASSSYYLTNVPIAKADWNIVAAVPKYPVLKPLIITYLIALIFVLVSTTLIYFSLKYLSKKLLKPISFLDKATKDVAIGKYDIEYPYEVNNEIGQLANSFKKMARKIKEYQDKMLSMSRFATIGETASQIAHDIRKPLSSLRSLLTILPEKRNDESFIRRMTRSVEGTITRTNTMLAEILEFSKDATSLEKKDCNPQSVITAALSDALTVTGDLDVSVEYDLRHRNYLNVDSDRIIRVMTNIVSNAVDAVSGNGKIWIRTEDIITPSPQPRKGAWPPLGFTPSPQGGAGVVMKVTIGNDGPVIPEDVKKKMFDPFFTTGKKGGTGLGLSICQKIVDMHGGKIWVESYSSSLSPSLSPSPQPSPQGGEGVTELVIELPASEGRLFVNESDLIRHSDELRAFREEEAAREEYGDSANTAEFMRLHKERGRPSYLLIVDDEPLFRETVQSLLRTIPQVRDHVKVVESNSAEEGLKLFEARKFDYVIADIDMGKNRMNGYEFAGILLDKYPGANIIIHSNKRREEMDKSIREIALSSRDKLETPRNDSNRFMGFLPKPMKQWELLQFLACKTFESVKAKQLPAAPAKKVLIVNDDDALLFSFKIMLKSPSLQVLEAMDVGTALRHLTDNKVDIILSDINLGDDEPDGYELLKKVRQKDKSLPFYLVSGYSHADEEPKARKLGANGYLQLPVEKDQLLEVIQ